MRLGVECFYGVLALTLGAPPCHTNPLSKPHPHPHPYSIP